MKGDKFYLDGKPCQRGHVDLKYVGSRSCQECRREATRKFRAANPEKAREQSRRSGKIDYQRHKSQRDAAHRHWRANNLDRTNERKRQRYVEDGGHRRAQNREWRTANLESAHAAEKRWRDANPGIRAATRRKRQAAEKQACPPWADLDAMKVIYVECARITAATGVPHHVDHIFPLRGENSCGLHIPINLQILPATENLRKHNKVPTAWLL